MALVVVGALAIASCGNASSKANSNNNTATTTAGGAGATTTTANLKQHDQINSPGVTDSEIRVSVVASITNPLGAKYGDLANGINAYFAMMNSTGGIYGRQLKVAKVRDDALGNNNAAVQQTLDQDNPLAVFIAALLFTGSKTLAAQNIPSFGWNINQEWTGPTNFFPNEGALCLGCAGPGLSWLAKQVGAKKVGVLSYNVQQSASCLDGDLRSLKKFGEATVAFEDSHLSFGVTDLSSQVAAMKRKGVQLIVTCMDQNGVFTLAKEMAAQGLNVPQEIVNGYDQKFMAANGKYFEGDYVLPQFTAFEHTPQPPAMQTFMQWMGKIGKPVDELGMQGWIAADQFVTGLKLAGPDFDRQKLIQALNTETHYTADGLLAPIDWTKQHQDPTKNPAVRGSLDCSNLVQVKSGKFVSAFGAPGKPWVCFKTADEHPDSAAPTPLPTPTNMSFVNYTG